VTPTAPVPPPDPADVSRPTVCLNMIVRNEAHIVREVLSDAAPLIDEWVVVDTGSTDGTQDVIREFFEDAGVAGTLHERPWRDFGTNRTEAIELCAGRSDYVWVIDADDRVVGDLDLTELRADAYHLRYGDDFTYWRKQIFRTSLRWRFEGRVHEYPVCLDAATEERLDGRYHIDSRRLGDRSGAADKYARDGALLAAAVAENPEDARSTFYLAQSYRDAGDVPAALEWYTRRVALGGWPEEVGYAGLQRGQLLERLGRPWAEALAAYLEAWRAHPRRAEPLHEIARRYRADGHYRLGYLFASRAAALPFPSDDSLFVASDVYRWRVDDERSVCAYYVGQLHESFDVSTRLLDNPSVPEPDRERILANRDFAAARIKDETLGYPAATVARLRDRGRDPAPDVTLSVTTCRRVDLFEATMNSFLNCCDDLDRIGRWICVDDNSSAADQDRMRARYPFFEFVFKGPDERGHARSIDQLRSMVTSRYWLHLEDDWHFFVPDRYVSKAIAILEHDPRLGQVLFNRNYGETLGCRAIAGGGVRTTDDGERYRVHEYADPGSDSYAQLMGDIAPGTLSNAWWPHFSLRPSLLRTAALAGLGACTASEGHFEFDLANEYAARGSISAFFDAINCLHLGPLTVEHASRSRPNAYDLNGEPQFGARPVARTTPSTCPVDDVVVISLDRRPDRWQAFVHAATETVGSEFVRLCRRVAAVDGAALVPTPEIERLFRDNDFGSRRGMIGCALSHLAAWRTIAVRDGGISLIFEDDARLSSRFLDGLARLVGARRDARPTPALVFLGYHPIDQPTSDVAGDGAAPRLEPMVWDDYLGGTFGYLLTPNGARQLLNHVERRGVHHGIDRVMQYAGATLVAARCAPPIVHSPVALSGSGVDSDIQYDFEPIR